MEVTVRSIPKTINVQTITLQPEDGNNLYGFHCLGCGNFHQKIGGKVSKVYPIYEPSEQVPVVSKCRNCSQEMAFQTRDGYPPERIKVILKSLQPINLFYCWKGKDKILEYSKTSIHSYVDNTQKKIPFDSPCSNNLCDTVYFFSQLV